VWHTYYVPVTCDEKEVPLRSIDTIIGGDPPDDIGDPYTLCGWIKLNSMSM